jgi:16S rRNA (uracil1498-N3)-methyltransferase
VTMHRFFLDSSTLTVGQSVALTPLAHQLYLVLRLPAGAQITLLDNSGDEFLTTIEQLTAKTGQGRVMARQPAPGETSLHLTLYQCSLKADKFEWVLQKGTELGVARFVPVISQRSVVRPAAALLSKYERWRAILREAAEQSGRGIIPTLETPQSWENAIHHATGTRLLPWEAAGSTMPSLHSVLRTPRFSLLIGPEGGIAPEEAAAAQAAGWQLVGLGPRILRAETAALAAITLVMLT